MDKTDTMTDKDRFFLRTICGMELEDGDEEEPEIFEGEEEKMTVDSPQKPLSDISESGYGDMEIKRLNNDPYRGEVIVGYGAMEVVFRGLILNFSITDGVAKFELAISDATGNYLHVDSRMRK